MDSAFGGLAIYKCKVFDAFDYNPPAISNLNDCEHVFLHEKMKMSGMQMYINPSLINSYWNRYNLNRFMAVRLFWRFNSSNQIVRGVGSGEALQVIVCLLKLDDIWKGDVIMNNNSIVVTGGAGFIGSEYVRQLSNSNTFNKIFVIDKMTYAADISRIIGCIDSGSVEMIECDINETEKYETIFKQIKSVVHFAAESHVDRSISNGVPFIETNVLGTYRLLEAVRHSGDIRTVIVSTDEVYGSVESGESNEESALNPSSAYSASKTSADLFSIAMNRTFGQNVVVTRGCNTYGPHQFPEKLIPLTLNQLLNGRKAPLYGDGQNVREWIHVSDHARAIHAVLLNGESGGIYNIGTGHRLTNVQVLETLIMELGLTSDVIEYVQDRAGHDHRYALDSTKVRNNLRWEPEIQFATGIRETIEWYRNYFNNGVKVTK